MSPSDRMAKEEGVAVRQHVDGTGSRRESLGNDLIGPGRLRRRKAFGCDIAQAEALASWAPVADAMALSLRSPHRCQPARAQQEHRRFEPSGASTRPTPQGRGTLGELAPALQMLHPWSRSAAGSCRSHQCVVKQQLGFTASRHPMVMRRVFRKRVLMLLRGRVSVGES